MMLDVWLAAFIKAIGKIFLQPLLYWAFILVFIASYLRIKRERIDFGYKIFSTFSELKQTWMVSLLFGLIISSIAIGVGIVFSYETIFLLSIVIIILSLTFKFTLLSASYTVGLTYLVLLLLPVVLTNDALITNSTNYTGLVLLLGILLFAEAFLLRRVKRNTSLPRLTQSQRGLSIGQHHLKKLSIIPFFTLVPNGPIHSVAPFWPYIDIGSQSYSLLFVPLLIGFDHIVTGRLPHHASLQLSRSMALLAFIVTVIAFGSIFIPLLSFVAVIIAILGREYINYKNRMYNRDQTPYFTPLKKGLKVLSIIPGTPADRLGILVGEVIVKVNGRAVRTVEEYYEALQLSGAFFKLDVIDDVGEVRFVQGAFYEGDHHKLGIIFTSDKYYDTSEHMDVEKN